MIGSLILISGTLSVFSQQQEVAYRHFFGYVKDPEDQPVKGTTVCGWDLSGRPIGGRIPCTQSQADGSFTLAIVKWEGDTYSLWVSDFEKGYPGQGNCPLCESFLFDRLRINVEGSDPKPIELRLEGVKPGRMTLRLVDDVSGLPVETGALKLCSVNDLQNCFHISKSFPNGIYEFLTPQTAFTLAVQWWDGKEWKDWTVFDEKHRKIDFLKIPLGESKKMGIRLRK